MTTRPSHLLTLLAVGCGSSQTAKPRAQTTVEHTAAPDDYGEWRSWTRVSSERFLSKGHGGKWVDVYVEPRFADAYRSASTPAPSGMRIAKAGYRDQAGTQFEALTVMAKMPAGYDSENGDWYYGVFAEDGRAAKMEGKLEMCVNCHLQAQDRDYLFGSEPR